MSSLGEQADRPEGGEEFLAVNDVEEEVPVEEQGEPIEEDDDETEDEPMDEDENEVIELDMSNNSWTYFDKHQDSVFTVIAHPKLPMVATGGGDNTAYLWTTHTQPPKLVTQLQGYNESVITGGFTADGEYFVSGDMSGKILVHKALKRGQQWKLVAELQEVEEVAWVKVHPRQPIFAFGAADGSVWVYQIESDSVEQLMSGYSHQDFCTNGEFIDLADDALVTLVTISEDSSIVAWNCFTGQPIWKIDSAKLKGLTPPWVSISKESPLDSNIIAVGARDAHLTIINASTGTILTTFKALEIGEDQDVYDSSIESVSWCSVQSILAVGMVSGNVILFDTKTWRARRNIKVDDAVTKIEFVPDTPVLIGASMNGKIYKWDSRTGKELFVGVGHNMGVLDFAFQNNGSKLITAGDEGVSLVFVTE